jgi:hypothetical protein
MDPDLMEDSYAQGVAYFFRILETDPSIQRDVLKYFPLRYHLLSDYFDELSLDDLRNALEFLLYVLCMNESDLGYNSLSSTWLLVVEAHLKTNFIKEELEDLYDIIVAWNYVHFERYAEDAATSAWYSDFLSVALQYKLFSYVEGKFGGKENVEKAGRPYLHALLAADHHA